MKNSHCQTMDPTVGLIKGNDHSALWSVFEGFPFEYKSIACPVELHKNLPLRVLSTFHHFP